MLASSRAPDVDVYAEVAALKRSHVSRTELSSLDVNETTIPLIQVFKRAYNVISELANMEVVTENKALRHICQRRATTGPLGLMEAEEVYV